MAEFTPPVIVVGMHRSGTSLLAGTLEKAGLFLGEVNKEAPHNKKGNRENEPLRNFHEFLLAKHGRDWKTPPVSPITWTEGDKAKALELLTPYRSVLRWGFKDPRALWLLEGYIEIFPDVQLAGIFRHPLAVAHSLAARPGALRLSREDGIKLWRITNARLLSVWRERRFPMLYFSKSGLDEPLYAKPLERLIKNAGLDSGAGSFFDRGLVHHTPGAEDLAREDTHLLNALIAAAEESCQ